MNFEDIDVSDWPTLRYADKEVTLVRGADFICLEAPLPRDVEIPVERDHKHIVTSSGLDKLMGLVGTTLPLVQMTRDRNPDFMGGLQKRDWLTSTTRLKKIHREGNG